MKDRWILCADRLPEKEGTYLCCIRHFINETPVYIYQVIPWCDGWNCSKGAFTGKYHNDYEIKGVIAWQEIEPFVERQSKREIIMEREEWESRFEDFEENEEIEQ